MSFSVSMACRQEWQIQQWVGLSATAGLPADCVVVCQVACWGRGQESINGALLPISPAGWGGPWMLVALPSQPNGLFIQSYSHHCLLCPIPRGHPSVFLELESKDKKKRRGQDHQGGIPDAGIQSPCSSSPLPFQRGHSLAENSCL